MVRSRRVVLLGGSTGQLGFRVSPRFRDLTDQRFWRAEMPGELIEGDYGPLEAIARNKADMKRITTWWPDMQCVGGASMSFVNPALSVLWVSVLFTRRGRWWGFG
ncbi:Tn3 family transposase, partial [Streptomyces sp. NPDC059970]|uniref:Tn3 family transposase n=1 Tax=Streptomyces sp. NPDC059970 TaxID=3347019 RepID=UPI0036B425BF